MFIGITLSKSINKQIHNDRDFMNLQNQTDSLSTKYQTSTPLQQDTDLIIFPTGTFGL